MRKFIQTIFLVALFSIPVACSGQSKKETKTTTPKKETISTEQTVVISEPIKMTEAMFKEKIWDYETDPQNWNYKGSLPCIVDFYADWCGPCRRVAPILDELAKEYAGKIIIYKINTDQEKNLSGAFGIRSIPSFLFCPMTDKPAMQAGAFDKEGFVKVIEEFLLKKKLD